MPLQPPAPCPCPRRLAVRTGKRNYDDEEGEEAPTHTFDDDSEDDTADPLQLLSFVGTAQAPSGYKILESCPSLETDENIQNLIGTKILHDWDNKDRQGYFEGRLHGRNLNARGLARAPTANFSVRYTEQVVDSWRQEEENYSTLSCGA